VKRNSTPNDYRPIQPALQYKLKRPPTDRLCCWQTNDAQDANMESDHILVVIKMRYTMSGASNTTPQQLRRFAVERLNNGNVTTMYRHELETELSDTSEPEPLSLNDKWKRMEEALRKATHENKREKNDSTWSANR
jgi:hypothetical protein